MQESSLNHKIFCFKDDKSNSYGPPIVMQTRGIFFRELADELAKGQLVWSKHPQDFSIYELGEYDARTGSIILHDSKTCLGLVQDLKVN